MDRMISREQVAPVHPVILSELNRKSPVHRTKRGGDVLVAVPDPCPHTTALQLQTGARSPGSLHLACCPYPSASPIGLKSSGLGKVNVWVSLSEYASNPDNKPSRT